MSDDTMSPDQHQVAAMEPEPDRIPSQVWLRTGNCEKPGRFTVVLECDGRDHLIYDSINECEGCISEHHSLHWALGLKHVARIAELERELAEACSARDQWRKAKLERDRYKAVLLRVCSDIQRRHQSDEVCGHPFDEDLDNALLAINVALKREEKSE